MRGASGPSLCFTGSTTPQKLTAGFPTILTHLGGYLGPYKRFALIDDCYDALKIWVGHGHTNYRALGKSTIDIRRGENIGIHQINNELVDYIIGVQTVLNLSRGPKPWPNQPILAELEVIR